MDAVREVAEVLEPPLEMAVRGLEEVRRALQVAGIDRRPRERHERADERLLRAVVEVALDAPPGVVGRAHHPPPRLGHLARDRRLGLGAARALLGRRRSVMSKMMPSSHSRSWPRTAQPRSSTHR